MMNKLFKSKTLNSMFVAAAFLLASGSLAQVSAQRDPFAKSPAAQPRTATGGAKTGAATTPDGKPRPTVPMPVVAPGIEDRIAYYKRMREAAAVANQPIPKVTSVLTLDEMSVVGIFRTPRGYAAMIEAKPIKLSYTVYPGEKFFDGQLVAIEENKLIFRKVTKMTNGKFIAAEENKTLREYSVKEEVQGTAPTDGATPATADKTEAAANQNPNAGAADGKAKSKTPLVISSPLEEMNKQPVESAKDSTKDKPSAKDKKGKKQTSSVKKPAAKTEKVAANQNQ